MKTISENTKYPEFREEYNGGEWITGHLVRINGVYFQHSKRVVTMYTEEELPEMHKASVLAYEVKKAEEEENINEMMEVIRARIALSNWAENNAVRFELSNKSESKYCFVEHEGYTYKIRVSGHRYPTGSMTNLNLCVIDATDDCREYCKMFNIEY
jgi:hypothetical protein